jgi:Integrase core domain
VQTVEHECLDHFVVFGEAHLDYLLSEFLDYYHFERPHQGLGNRPPSGTDLPPATFTPSEMECERRRGGLLRHYRRPGWRRWGPEFEVILPGRVGGARRRQRGATRQISRLLAKRGSTQGELVHRIDSCPNRREPYPFAWTKYCERMRALGWRRGQSPPAQFSEQEGMHTT